MSFVDWERWLAAGLVLMALETLVPGAFLVWVGIAAICTAAVTFALALSFGGQVAIFIVFAALSVAIGLRQRRGRTRSQVNTPQSGLVGREVEVLTFDGERGRVRLGDSDWPARLAIGTPPPAPGVRLIVRGVDGMVLVLAASAD